MAYTTITDDQVKQDAPLDEPLMTALRDRDRWNYTAATNGGSGVAPSVTGLQAVMTSHGHSGTGDEPPKIPTDGIADGAVFDPDMIDDDAVGPTEINSNTMGTGNLADGAVLTEKMDGTMGEPFSGSQAFDPEDDPVAGRDSIFKGDTARFTNPKGAVGVVVHLGIFWFVKLVTASQITLGLRWHALDLVDPDTAPYSGYII